MQLPETKKCFILCESDVVRMVRNDSKVFQFPDGECMRKRSGSALKLFPVFGGGAGMTFPETLVKISRTAESAHVGDFLDPQSCGSEKVFRGEYAFGKKHLHGTFRIETVPETVE